MRPSIFRSGTRRPAARRLCAVVTAAAFCASGCAAHAWRPLAEPAAPSPGRTVRAVGPAGEVWLNAARREGPFLSGRPLGGNGRIRVALTPDTSIRVRRCGRPGETLGVRGPTTPGRAAGADAIVGCDVQLETREGLVAVTVERVTPEGEIVGRMLDLDCRGTRSCAPAPVRLDVREYTRLEERTIDEGRTVRNVLLGTLLLPLAVIAVWGTAYVVACSRGCD